MLIIDRLRLRMPSGSEHRASEIARLVAEALADLDYSSGQRMETLSLPPITAPAVATNRQLAAAIAKGIATSLEPKQ